MSSKRELDEGIKSIKSAWQREHTARANLEKMLENAESENDKLREQMEQLVTLLRVDCDIEASWDGLRNFWSISLTKDGLLIRDMACKAEAENARLREQLSKPSQANLCLYAKLKHYKYAVRARYSQQIMQLMEQNEKLRELVNEMYEDQCDECDRWKYRDRMRELGIEVDA